MEKGKHGLNVWWLACLVGYICTFSTSFTSPSANEHVEISQGNAPWILSLPPVTSMSVWKMAEGGCSFHPGSHLAFHGIFSGNFTLCKFFPRLVNGVQWQDARRLNLPRWISATLFPFHVFW